MLPRYTHFNQSLFNHPRDCVQSFAIFSWNCQFFWPSNSTIVSLINNFSNIDLCIYSNWWLIVSVIQTAWIARQRDQWTRFATAFWALIGAMIPSETCELLPRLIMNHEPRFMIREPWIIKISRSVLIQQHLLNLMTWQIQTFSYSKNGYDFETLVRSFSKNSSVIFCCCFVGSHLSEQNLTILNNINSHSNGTEEKKEQKKKSSAPVNGQIFLIILDNFS
jgi:hypothetical protein